MASEKKNCLLKNKQSNQRKTSLVLALKAHPEFQTSSFQFISAFLMNLPALTADTVGLNKNPDKYVAVVGSL